MENIDDFMRQKFDSDDPGERFEFQEEYWEKALALLEKDEERRRRRLWLFWGLVLAMALLLWFLLVQWHAGSLSDNQTRELYSTTLTEKTENQADTNEKLAATEQITHLTNSLEQPADGSTRPEWNLSESTVPEKPAQGNNPNQLKVKDTPESSNSENTRYVAPIPDEPLREAPNLKKSLAASQQQSGEKEFENTSTGNSTTQDKESPISSPLITTEPSIIPLIILPVRLVPVELPWTDPVVAPKLVTTKESLASNIKPFIDQKFTLGLSLSGAAYQTSDTMGRWASWTVGAFGDYRLNKNFSLIVAAQIRFVPGFAAMADSSNPAQSEQLRYSFGYRLEQWKQETRGLHFLEVPVSARWQKGPWGLETGAAAGMLLWVQNRKEYTVESSLESAKRHVDKFVKGNTEPYNQNYFSAFAGAEYRLNHRFSVLTRAQYRFTPVFKTLGEGVKNQGLMNVELGLRVRLL